MVVLYVLKTKQFSMMIFFLPLFANCTMSGRQHVAGAVHIAVLFVHGFGWHVDDRTACVQQTPMVSSFREDAVEGASLAGWVVGPPLRRFDTDAWLMTRRKIFLT